MPCLAGAHYLQHVQGRSLTTATGAEEVLVAYTFQLDERTEVRAYLQPYKGQLYAHIRRFKRWNPQDDLKPEKGIAVPAAEVKELLVAAAMLITEHRQSESTTSSQTRHTAAVGETAPA
jgi:hypothetical protein